jgi:hypothetical protein
VRPDRFSLIWTIVAASVIVFAVCNFKAGGPVRGQEPTPTPTPTIAATLTPYPTATATEIPTPGPTATEMPVVEVPTLAPDRPTATPRQPVHIHAPSTPTPTAIPAPVQIPRRKP